MDRDESFRSTYEYSHHDSYESLSNHSADLLRIRPDISQFYSTPSQSGSKIGHRKSCGQPAQNLLATVVPSDVLKRIFSYLNKEDLTNTMATCKRFYEIGKNSMFWSFLNLSNKILDETSLHTLLDRRIKVLRMNTTTVTAFPWETPALNYPAMLTHLDLSVSKFDSPVILTRILKRCNRLQALSLESCESIDESVCRAIGQNAGLQILNLCMARNFTVEGIAEILHHCRRLQELNIAWANLNDDVLHLICQQLPPCLKKLNLSGCRNSPVLNDTYVKNLCVRCPNLDELDLSDNTEITDSSLQIMMMKLPRLRVLTLSRCYGIEPISLISMKRLQVLNVYGCVTEEGTDVLRSRLRPTAINYSPLSTIARPTTGESVTSIWGNRTRDCY